MWDWDECCWERDLVGVINEDMELKERYRKSLLEYHKLNILILDKLERELEMYIIMSDNQLRGNIKW